MSRVDPLLQEIFNTICPKEHAMDIPCRVSADIRNHHADLNHAEQPKFDEYDDAMMKEILGDRLWKPVQELLITLNGFKATRDSFGADDKRVVERLIPELEALRQGCIEEWQDL